MMILCFFLVAIEQTLWKQEVSMSLGVRGNNRFQE